MKKIKITLLLLFVLAALSVFAAMPSIVYPTNGAYVSGTSVTLDWTDSLQCGFLGCIYMTDYYSLFIFKDSTQIVSLGPFTSLKYSYYTLTGLTPGSKYSWYVYSNGFGWSNGPASASFTVSCSPKYECQSTYYKAYHYSDCTWGPATYCPAGCSNGACLCISNGNSCSQPGTCTSACCSGVCNIGGTCGPRSNGNSCAVNEECTSGKCINSKCGNCYTNSDCGSTQYCSSNICKADICSQGTTYCKNGDVYTCAADGSYDTKKTECGTYSCDMTKGGCYAVCTAGDTGNKRCNNNILEKEQVNTACTKSWTTDTNCNNIGWCGVGTVSCSGKDRINTWTDYGYLCNSISLSCVQNPVQHQQVLETCPYGCSSSVCKDPVNFIDLYDKSIVPTNPSLTVGQSFTIKYTIKNTDPSAQKIGLGASIVSSGGIRYDDSAHDSVVTVNGGATTTVERTFTIGANVPLGTYDVIWGLWQVKNDGTIDFTKYIDGSGLTDNNLVTVTSGQICGNNIKEGTEFCDGNSQNCAIGAYTGIQTCNSLCNGWNSCTATRGKINGTRFDADTGARLIGVKVEILKSGTVIDTQTTNTNGYFMTNNIDAGYYDIRNSKTGYETTTYGSVQVLAGKTSISNAVLFAGQSCGNNLKQGNEVCDGTDLTGQTCVSKGFSSGTLKCKSDCTGYDTSLCISTSYINECSNFNDYFCENGWVKQCYNNGKYWQKGLIMDCSGKYSYCDEAVVDGTKSCSVTPNHLDVWIDYANTGVKVNKQRGDKLKLNIYSEQAITVPVSYDTNTYQSSCPTSFSLVKGINSCDLTVKATAPLGDRDITVKNKVADISIIDDPELLVITDSEKLYQRYPYEDTGVKAVLKQTYANAENKGVVYDLSWYKTDIGATNPFSTYTNYNEVLTRTSIKNDYSSKAASFVKERCNACKDVMIVGDDFVVPYYRRNIPILDKNWFFFDSERIESIYTDVAYSNKKMLEFYNYYEMFKQDGKYQGKDVLVILPNGITTAQRTQIDRLKQAINSKGYGIDFSEMDGKNAYCVDPSWFSNVKGKTLIIIGNENNNNAFKCMPFVSGESSVDAAFIQPNVWDNKEYSIVINTNDPDIIKTFALLIESGDITKLRSQEAYFFKIGTETAGYIAMGVGIAALAVGTGGTAPLLLIGTATVLDAVSDYSGVADSCVINQDGFGSCAVSGVAMVIPLVNGAAIKKLVRNGIKDFDNLPTSVKEFIVDRVGKAAKYGNSDVMTSALRNYNPKYVAKGYERLLGTSEVTELAIVKSGKISEESLAEGFYNIGRLDDAAVDLSGAETVLRTQGDNPGHWAEIKRAASLLDTHDVRSVSKMIDGAEIDIFVKDKWTNTAVVEQVKDWNQNSWSYASNINKAKAQINKIADFVANKRIEDGLTITKARLVVRNDINLPKEIVDLANSKKVEIAIFEGVD